MVNRLEKKNGIWQPLPFVFSLQRFAGTTYYVDYVAGDDSNNGTSTSTPFKRCPGDTRATGTADVTTLSAGDTVIFKGGVEYDLVGGTLWVDWSGSSGNYIHYKSGHLGSVWGSGRAVFDTLDGGQYPIRWNNGLRNYNKWEGVEIYSSTPADSTSHTGFWIEGSYNVITDCYLHDLYSTAVLQRRGHYNEYSYLDVYDIGNISASRGNGIDMESGCRNVTHHCVCVRCGHQGLNAFISPYQYDWEDDEYSGWQDYNEFHHCIAGECGDHGMYSRFQRYFKVYNIIFYDNVNYGVYFSNGQGQVGNEPSETDCYGYLMNCTIVGNGADGLFNQNYNYLTHKNCIYKNNCSTNGKQPRQIITSKTTGVVFDYNLYDSGTGGLVIWGTGDAKTLVQLQALSQETNGVAGDADFDDEESDDYHIGASSDALDAGADLSGDGVTDDYDGVSRPQGGGFDIGAYEYPSGSGSKRIFILKS